jgi:DNA-binding response OmpR family regulator
MRVLVIEKNPDALDALVMTLEAYQHATARARDEAEALARPEAEWADVWVLGREIDREKLQTEAQARFGHVPACVAVTSLEPGMEPLERALQREALAPAAAWN